MRRTIVFISIACIILLNISAFAQTASLAGQYIDGKFYVEPGTVHVGQKEIFLNVDGNFIPVDFIGKDEDGIYVLGYDVKRMVYCHKCGRTYNADRYSSRCPHTDEWCQYSVQ